MGNGFKDYYSHTWTIVRKLAPTIFEVKDDEETGYYVADGLSKAVFVFSEHQPFWTRYDATILDDRVLSTSTAQIKQYSEYPDIYEKLSAIIVHNAISEE